jgi:hypothetical protein
MSMHRPHRISAVLSLLATLTFAVSGGALAGDLLEMRQLSLEMARDLAQAASEACARRALERYADRLEFAD